MTPNPSDILNGARWDLRLGDCIEGLAGLPDKCVDHVICDPPYEAEAHSKGRRIAIKGTTVLGQRQREVMAAPISYPPITEPERTEAARQFARICQRWVIVFCQSEAAHLWRSALVAGGAQYIRTGVYWKEDAQPQYNGQCPGVGWEAIVIAHGMPRKGPTRWNGGGKCARWDASADARYGKKLLVDGQKPIRLMEQLVADFTDHGELVLDPFAGSGTTGVACVNLGRRFIGWERDPKHHAIASDRIGKAREQLTWRPEKLAPVEQMGLLK